jgi:thymidylate synthase (FAD)
VACRVLLLTHTPDPEAVVAQAARLCYSPLDIEGLSEILGPEERARLIARVVSMGHHSVLEHASFTFGIEGVSRAMTHQLVRHRIASYSQQSQRYVEFTGELPVVVPESISSRDHLGKRFAELCGETAAFYQELLRADVPAEDARFILPAAVETKLLVTMNARELRHLFTLRLCLRAQWEIRETAEAMLALARAAAPALFVKAGPACVSGPCPEGNLTCGRIEEVRARYRPTGAAAGTAGGG